MLLQSTPYPEINPEPDPIETHKTKHRPAPFAKQAGVAFTLENRADQNNRQTPEASNGGSCRHANADHER
jgi:hypothetical protein